MQKASLDKAGKPGEYVAMAWPPMAAKEIVVSEIIGPATNTNRATPLGAWATVEQKELHRIPLEQMAHKLGLSRLLALGDPWMTKMIDP